MAPPTAQTPLRLAAVVTAGMIACGGAWTAISTGKASHKGWPHIDWRGRP